MYEYSFYISFLRNAFLYGYYFFTHNVPMERVHHISFSCELNRKSTNNFYNLEFIPRKTNLHPQNSAASLSNSVLFPLRVLWQKIAPSFLAQLLLEIPLFTSQKYWFLIFGLHLQNHPATFLKPPLITSPNQLHLHCE